MYQWAQRETGTTEKVIDGTKQLVGTYAYDQVWAAARIDSSQFFERGHQNPQLPIQNATFDAQDAAVGGFQIAPGLLDQIDAFDPVPAPPEDVAAASAALGAVVHQVQGCYVVGANPDEPAIGDLRICYDAVPLDLTVSVLGGQTGKTITDWTTPGGHRLVARLVPGRTSVDSLYEAAEPQSATLRWSVRGAGALLLFVGLFLSLGTVLTRWRRRRGVRHPLAWGAPLTLAVAGTLATIGAVWLPHVQAAGGALLAGAGVLVLGFVVFQVRGALRRRAKRREAKAAH